MTAFYGGRDLDITPTKERTMKRFLCWWRHNWLPAGVCNGNSARQRCSRCKATRWLYLPEMIGRVIGG